MNNIPDNLKDLTDSATDDFHEPFDLEGNVNPQLNYQCNAQESVLIPNTPLVEEINIVPGEGKNIFHMFPTGKYGCTVKWDIKLSSVNYFNQRLLNFTQMFAFEANYIFYAISVTQ